MSWPPRPAAPRDLPSASETAGTSGSPRAPGTGTTDDLESTRRRVAKLSRENRELKRLLAALSSGDAQVLSREIRLLHAIHANRDGVWDWNAATNEVSFSAQWKEMLGYTDEDIADRFSEWESRVHPDDLEQALADLRRHLAGETPYYENEHRILCKDGSYKWILDRGKIVTYTEDGRPRRVVGTHTDIHRRKTVELDNARLVEELSAALRQVRQLSGLRPSASSARRSATTTAPGARSRATSACAPRPSSATASAPSAWKSSTPASSTPPNAPNEASPVEVRIICESRWSDQRWMGCPRWERLDRELHRAYRDTRR